MKLNAANPATPSRLPKMFSEYAASDENGCSARPTSWPMSAKSPATARKKPTRTA